MGDSLEKRAEKEVVFVDSSDHVVFLEYASSHPHIMEVLGSKSADYSQRSYVPEILKYGQDQN